MYTYRWVSLLVWLYFTEGVVRAWSDRAPGNYLAARDAAVPHAVRRLRAARARAPAGERKTPSTPDDRPDRPNCAPDRRRRQRPDRRRPDAWEQDWRKRVRGKALAVVRPGSTPEVAAVVKACAAAGASIVPQGGNTGWWWAACRTPAARRWC
jgi:hypothetical protein